MKSTLGAVVVILASAICANAAVTLDQQHDTATATADSSNGSVSEMAQTFTVGIAGTLDHIDVSMFQLGSIFTTSGDPKLSVYNTAAGAPTGAPLTTIQISTTLVPLGSAAFVTFDVSGAAIPVTVGEVLAFGVSTTSDPGPYFMPDDTDTGAIDDYTAGAAYRRTLPAQPWQLLQPFGDHEFRTYVNALPVIPGDVDHNGVVNGLDIGLIAGHWLSTGAPGIPGDADNNGVVNGLDISVISAHWLFTTPTGGSGAGNSTNPVPEPSTFMLAALGGLTLLAISRRSALLSAV